MRFPSRGVAASLALTTALVAAPAAAQRSTDAQGAGEPVTRIVVFGDSLADGGFFLADPTVPRDAGSFTTNPDPVAPEVFAARLGIDLRSAYPASGGGTNFAIGGARSAAAGATSAITPIATQVANFIAANPRFDPSDLVYIQGGGNDYFAFQAGGSRDNTILTTAATQLAAATARVQAAGAQRIVTLAVQTGGAPGLQLFNSTYAAALAANNVNALYFNTDKLFNEIVANAGAFGITNVTGQACTVASSVRCNRSTLVTPNANETYLLADSVHPAGITQRIEGQAIASVVQAPEQIAGLAYAAQNLFRSQRELFEGPERGGALRDGHRLSVFGGAGYHYFSHNGSAQRIGLNERGFSGVLGADLALGASSGIGVVGGYSDGHGRFEQGAGSYDTRAWTASGYARVEVGPVRLLADGSYGQIDQNNIRRAVQLGPTNRSSDGDTDGDYYAGRLTGAADLVTVAGLAFGPDLSVSYERLKLDGYAEKGTLSTDLAFGRQRIESLTGRFGAVVRSVPDNAVRFFARGNYEREFKDDPRGFTITPSGAPISYTTGVERADRDYLSYAMAVDGTIAGALSLRGGVSGQALRDKMDSVTAFAGLSLAM